jgi:hypothetical protein
MKIAIEPNISAVIQQIFYCFVVDRLGIATIVQKLNSDPEIPLPEGAAIDWLCAGTGAGANANGRGLVRQGEVIEPEH